MYCKQCNPRSDCFYENTEKDLQFASQVIIFSNTYTRGSLTSLDIEMEACVTEIQDEKR